MADQQHLARLRESVDEWNAWRSKQSETFIPDLAWAELPGQDLSGADLRRAYLRGAKLNGATLQRAVLWKADLAQAHLRDAKLQHANLRKANLFEADLSGANLQGANLTGTMLVDTRLMQADLTGCFVYGCSIWGAKLRGACQADLIIADAPGSLDWRAKAPSHAPLTTDNLEMAQFLHLLRENERLRLVIDTITAKVVLILGRFTTERKDALDAIRQDLRNLGLLPVMFDFETPDSRTTVETAALLANMARFVIADVTDAKSVLQELQAIVPTHPSLPVQPLLLEGQEEPGMFDFFKPFDWFLPVHKYRTVSELRAALSKHVIAPAERRAREIIETRATGARPK